MNELLMQLLGFGGGGYGNYNPSGGPAGPYGGYDPYGGQQPGPGWTRQGTQIGFQPGQRDPNTYGPWQPPGAGTGYDPSGGGQVASGNKAGQPSGGVTNQPAPAAPPPGVGTPGWTATHPDYNPKAAIPTVGSPGWIAGHPDYKAPTPTGYQGGPNRILNQQTDKWQWKPGFGGT